MNTNWEDPEARGPMGYLSNSPDQHAFTALEKIAERVPERIAGDLLSLLLLWVERQKRAYVATASGLQTPETLAIRHGGDCYFTAACELADILEAPGIDFLSCAVGDFNYGAGARRDDENGRPFTYGQTEAAKRAIRDHGQRCGSTAPEKTSRPKVG